MGSLQWHKLVDITRAVRSRVRVREPNDIKRRRETNKIRIDREAKAYSSLEASIQQTGRSEIYFYSQRFYSPLFTEIIFVTLLLNIIRNFIFY